MADTCCEYSIAGLVINNDTGDCLLTDFDEGQILGLDGAPIRRQIDPAPQQNGGLVHPAFLGPRIVTFSGKVLIRSVTDSSSLLYAAAVNAVESGAVSALEGILNSSSNLTWTPTGGSGKTLSVRYGTEGGEIQFTGNMLDRRFSFTLFAANPTIS